MSISVMDKQGTARIDRRWLARKAQKLLEILGCPAEELSVLLVDDGEMAEINGRYRGEKRPTDVLAFPMREGAFHDLPTGLLGDVVISVESARRQTPLRRPAGPRTEEKVRPPVAREGEALGGEVLRLLIHGTLHLLGHDHQTPKEARKMRAEENRCFRALGPKGKANP
ncbi:MAG: rRNA maturation RNase YbeY [bacterium]